MSPRVDEQDGILEGLTPHALLALPSHEIARHIERCERLICANQASEREYALYISGTRELVRRRRAP